MSRSSQLIDEISFLPAWELAAKIKAKELSPVEVTEHFLMRIDRIDPNLKAFITVAADQAEESARAAESKIMKGKSVPPLFGVPLAVKDTLFTESIRTTGASLVYKDFVPDRNAGAVERLIQSGAIILGKTTTPEFAMGGGLSYNRLIDDDCHNPWDVERTASASSGGSAASVAAGLVPIAIGSDAGGSIRLPAACCGVYGLKQTNGRVPAYNAFESMPMFNVVGPITRCVRDAAIMLEIMAGYDPRDPLSIRQDPPRYSKSIDENGMPLRIAWSPDLGRTGLNSEIISVVESAVRIFGSLGDHVEDHSPNVCGLERAFMTIAQADLYAGHGEILERNPEKFTTVLKSIMEEGKGITGSEYAKALWSIDQIRDQMVLFFKDYDLLITPTLGVATLNIKDVLRHYGETNDELNAIMTFTVLANLIRAPSASIPCGFTSDGLPIGMLITGRPGEEEIVLGASAKFENACPWIDQMPPVG